MLRGLIYGLLLCAVAAVAAALVFPLPPEPAGEAAPAAAGGAAPAGGGAAETGAGGATGGTAEEAPAE